MTPTAARLYGSQPDVRSMTVKGLITCDSKTGLARIADPEVEMVIWRRTLSPEIQAWVDSLPSYRLPDLRVLVSPCDLRRVLLPLLEGHGLSASPMRDWLIKDIDSLAKAFAGITGTDLVDIRLERIDHDACWKFHRDSVPVRLIATYRGPGTQWVLPSDADRALAKQRAYVGRLERVPEHAVAVFKGCRAADGAGIVHRSPPVGETGVTRWLLCLNDPSSASPDPWEP